MEELQRQFEECMSRIDHLDTAMQSSQIRETDQNLNPNTAGFNMLDLDQDLHSLHRLPETSSRSTHQPMTLQEIANSCPGSDKNDTKREVHFNFGGKDSKSNLPRLGSQAKVKQLKDERKRPGSRSRQASRSGERPLHHPPSVPQTSHTRT